MSQRELTRPLSPYLQYVNARTLHTMGFSILHRITGVALSVGALPLVYWLTAAALGPESYAAARDVLASFWMQALMAGWVFGFCYHLLNGIRHLVWDTGRGFDQKVSLISGYSVFVAAIVLAVLIYAWFATRGGGL